MQDLLAEAHEEMVEDLLRPIFNGSDYWPKQIAADILSLPGDDEYEWEELLERFEAQEQREGNDKPDQVDWTREGF